MDDKNLVKFTNLEDIKSFLKNPQLISSAITGILLSGKSEWVLSAGKIVQATIKSQMLEQLGKELNDYSKKGIIKENFFETEDNQSSLIELLKFIDEEVPDKERFKAMKSIFFASLEKDISSIDERLTYQFMQICKKLSSGEILVLKAAFEISNGKLAELVKIDHMDSGAHSWLQNISKQIGHGIPALVEHHEDHLMSLKVIGARTHSDQSGVVRGDHYRLTSLGFKLCEFITKYD